MPIRGFASLHTENNLGGLSHYFSLGLDERYHRLRMSELMNTAFWYDISSASVWCAKGNMSLILFKSYYGPWPIEGISQRDFDGEFVQITAREQDMKHTVGSLGQYLFGNLTTNALLVSTDANPKLPDIRISFRDMFLNTWLKELDDSLQGTEAERDGEPVLTWSMWPKGVPVVGSTAPFLDQNRIYLLIHQPLNIILECWWDYKASITYHLFLYLNKKGNLRGCVARLALWVESGMKHGEIFSRLWPEVVKGMDKLNAALYCGVTKLPSVDYSELSYDEIALRNQLQVEFSDLYFLPGRQLDAAPTGVITGNTLSDVTIVLQW